MQFAISVARFLAPGHLDTNGHSERVAMKQNTINFSPFEEYPYNSEDALKLLALPSLSPTFMTATMPDAAN